MIRVLKYFVLVFLFGLSFACSDSDKQLAEELCECIKQGEIANEYSASFFERDYSEQGKDSLDQMLKERDEVCEKFIDMHPNDLQKAAEDCELLDFETDSIHRTN